MRSCVDAVVAVVLLLALVATGAQAQSRDPAAAYRERMAREKTIRAELETPGRDAARAALLKRARALVSDYDAMARTFPTSGYSDNALWQGGMLAADLYWQFGEASDRQTARRMLEAVRARFPTSSLVKGIPDQLARLDRPRTPPQTAGTTPAPGGGTRPASTASPASQRPASQTGGAARTSSLVSTLTGIRREPMPDVLRMTLLLEHERPYVTHRLEDPARLVIDLDNTRVLYALKDSDLSYADDVVRRVRVGSHEGERTRVVFDLDGAGRASVYPLYQPYRLVVDLQRTRPAAPAVAAATTGTTGTPAASPAHTTSAAGGGSAPATGGATAATAAASTRPAPPATAPPAPATANGSGGYSLSRQLGLGISRIVIDPGHGGHDPGATVTGLTEASLVLDVALRLETLLRAHPNADVVLTRRTDTFVSLEERTAFANREKADLFLSIHANASTNTKAYGIETYFLNFAIDAQAEAIAARENAGSARTMANLPEIVRSIALNDKIDESRDFATTVQKSLFQGLRKVNANARDLGVKQAPFQVLIGARMPSILAEISFITNKEEGDLLKTDTYRQEIAQALFDGVIAYMRTLKDD
jgi:N-acetylmuramoyl-L-alanine amidase